MEKTKAKYLATPCCNAGVRAEVTQDVDVEIDENGHVDNGCDFSDPQINEDFMHCEECGEQVELDYNEDTKSYSLKLTDK